MILEQYEEGIWYDRIKHHFKHPDTRHHYSEIVRGLKWIINAWKIIEEKQITDTDILDAIYISTDISLEMYNGKIVDHGVLDAQNISHYVLDIAAIAILVN